MFFTIEIQEIRRSNRIFKCKVKRFTTMKEIKIMLQKTFPFPLNALHLFHTSRSSALANHMTLHEIGIDRDGFLLILSITVSCNAPQSVHILEPLLKESSLDATCKEMVQIVRQGLLLPNQSPGKTDLLDCTGGVYFMKAMNGSLAAVFKPHDEEQGMPNNPKGYAGNGKVGLREYFNPGEGYLREAAAYLLDVNNLAKVPPTCIVHCEHPSFHYPHFNGTESSCRKSIYPKLGSLQQYIKAADTFEDISPSLISVYELQKIALLDLRILNCDRNSANILAIRKEVNASVTPRVITNAAGTARRDSRSGSLTSNGEDYDFDTEMDMNDFMNRSNSSSSRSSKNADQYELIPIDHGYCLPTKLCIEEFDWVWFHCPQIEQPIDPALKQYMREINIDDCIANLEKQVSLPEDSIFLLRLTHQLILQGMEQGLTLREIAELIVRVEDGIPSPLEKAIKSAEENAQRAVAVHGGVLKSSKLSSPPRKFSNKSPVNNHTVGAVSRNHQNSVASSITDNATTITIQTAPAAANTAALSVCLPTATVSDVNKIVNNVLLLPKAATATTMTVYPMRDHLMSVPSASVSVPLFRTPSKPLTAAEMTDHGDGDDFLLRESYLRPRGPITVVKTLDSKLLPVTSSLSTMNQGSVSSSMSSSTSPNHELIQRNGLFFARNFSPEYESTTESCASSADTNQSLMHSLDAIASSYSNGEGNHLSILRECSTSSSQDDNDCRRGGSSSRKESSFVPVRSPDICIPRTDSCIDENDDRDAHNFIDDEDNENCVPPAASNDNGLRRVSSFSLLEVQTTEPMVFEKPSKLMLSRESSGNGGYNGKEQQRLQHHSSGFTSEEEMEETSNHASDENDLNNVSPYGDFMLDSRDHSSSSFSLANKLAATHGLTRVVSFNAFESPALYEFDRADRHLHRLKREKRKLSVKSPEFQELRMAFAQKAIVKTIAHHALKVNK